MTIGVLWISAQCPLAQCYRVASSLFSADPADPIFTQ
jgi:hypothetical protein